MAAPIYKKHPPALATTYADVENHALNQEEALVGTPGTISIRENASGSKFHVRQYYDYEGKKKDQYIAGPPGSRETERSVQYWRKRIEEAKEVQKSVRLLIREGYSALTPKHLAALAPLYKYKIFDAGAVLVGTHAFEVIVNRMGIRVAVFATEDVDVARPNKLAVKRIPKGGLLELLRESGIDFVDVPGAHATALPYLRYLLSESQTGAAISSHGVVAVRIPIPERFALHKLLVAQLRKGRPEKSSKDLKQAAVLIAALGEIHPGALEAAFQKTPVSSRKHIRNSLRQIRDQLERHPQSWEEIAVAAKA
jgi:hypothetical protein